MVDIPGRLYYTTKGIEAWLSLVERCVRDAEAACSNHVASIYLRPDGQAAKTTPSHGVNPGSIPGQVMMIRLLLRQQPYFSGRYQDSDANILYASVAQLVVHFTRNEGVTGSSPVRSLQNRPSVLVVCFFAFVNPFLEIVRCLCAFLHPFGCENTLCNRSKCFIL